MTGERETMNIRNAIQFSCLSLVLLTVRSAAADNSRWWPVQAMPRALVRTKTRDEPPASRAPVEMMVQSIAGLAAKAVNDGRADEMVWVDVEDNVDVADWLARLLQRHPQVEMRGSFAPWALVDRYAKQGLIKGYILYRADTSSDETNSRRPGMDCSVNVATSVAGLFDGIIVDESLEATAKAHGLARLLDVRDKTQAWCFATYQDRFNRRIICLQDPRKPNVRDLAIAQRTLVLFGDADPVPAVVKWLDPLSPVLGWNGGDEFKTTALSSVWGHFQTATDWAVNLPVLMAGTEAASQSQVKNLDPRTINFDDTRSAVSFVDTDGDNVDWSEGDFFRARNSRNYWANPDRGKIPFGWSCCFAHLAQLCPEAIDYAAVTQSPNDSFIEGGGGYYYPDLFARRRSNRWELLAQHAQRTWTLMKKNHTRLVWFNVAKLDSADARKAYEVFARETDGLLGILVFQYDPYEAGAGQTFWVKDRNGLDVPVVSARYSIWNHSNQRSRAGTPAKVAREIRQTVEKVSPKEQPRYDWVIVHAWSWFRKAPGADENAENMPQEDAPAKGGESVYGPAMWCAERLPSNIQTIGPEELVWRLRMKHNPQQTKALMEYLER
jgi:hypothetical protein